MSATPPRSRTPNFLLAALGMPAHLFALLAGAVASLVLGDWVPLAAAAGASGAYLALLSTTPSFRRAVRANLDAQGQERGGVARELEALLAELAPSQREHYRTLQGLRDDILARYARVPGGRVLAASSAPRLDALLASFLRLVTTLNGYRRFLGAADRLRLEEELRVLEADLAVPSQSEKLKEVKARRAELLGKRVQRYRQAAESREVVSHQLASIEDLLRLTYEQSIAVRDPELVGRQLEALTAEVAATEDTVQELEQFMHISEEFSSTESLPSPGSRVR